jgi:predicted  nucleic acid-binding Zn-ribbon protein
MATDQNSTFPGSLRDHQDVVEAEAQKISTKIDDAFAKLAKKMRERADKAKSKMDGVKKSEKRAVLLRRFELYAGAATYLEERLVHHADRSE